MMVNEQIGPVYSKTHIPSSLRFGSLGWHVPSPNFLWLVWIGSDWFPGWSWAPPLFLFPPFPLSLIFPFSFLFISVPLLLAGLLAPFFGSPQIT